ncbi:MAG: kelch repeat-containing protein [Sphaerobacter sp.]|nr:kelch repeat-containing protein [Sphaerobacter sp.]
MGFQPIIPGTNPLASDVQQIIDALTGRADAGALSLFPPISAPGAPTVAVSQTAGVLNGTYTYKITFVTGFVRSDGTLVYTGETRGGTTSASVSPANQQVTLSNIPVGPAGVIARRIYRTVAGGADGTQKFVAEIGDNVTTTYVDNVADASLGVAVPTSNTTGTTIPPSAISPQGAGSGLDADKVDGYEAASLLPQRVTLTSAGGTKASMPTAREGLAAAAVNNVIYAIGGYNGTSYLATVEAYDPSSNTWTSKAAMPTARGYLAAAAVNNVIYAIGGYNSGLRDTNLVQAYDPSSNTWTSKAAMPTARHGLAAAVVNNIVYAVGGTNGTDLATVEAGVFGASYTMPRDGAVGAPNSALIAGLANQSVTVPTDLNWSSSITGVLV